MRVIFLIIRYAVTIGLTLVILAAITREVLLFWGITQVRTAENKMELMAGAVRKTEYDQQCKQKGGDGVERIQLRFSSSTEYQLEVVCGHFSNDPIVTDTYVLPPMVKKVGGQSGFIANKANTSGVALEVFKRRTSIKLEEGKIRVSQGVADFVGVQPAAACGGFGYACCIPETEVGSGQAFVQATDCPQQCFSVCLPRPTVLKFTSDPNPDLKSKIVTSAKGVPITFYYVIDPGQTELASAVLDFGDGHTESLSEKEGNFTYQYKCQETECLYKATVMATDGFGNTSVITPVSTITVVVR